jgi:hypothetical protein
MPKLSSYPAATTLAGATFPILQDGVNKTASNLLGLGTPTALGFWVNVGSGANIYRFRDRAFVGDACDDTGLQNPTLASQKSWVGNADNGYMTYFETRSQLASFQTIGGVGIAGASRSSNNTRVGENNTMGVAGYVRNDNTNAADKKAAWALYGHAAQMVANAFTAAIEVDTCSIITLVPVTPFSTGATGTTASAWVGVGGETAQGLVANGQGAQLTNVSAAICVINSASAAAGNRFDKGLVFQATALNGTDGVTGTATAIAMAKGHIVSWYNSAGTVSSSIRSDGTASAQRVGQIFQDDSLWFLARDALMTHLSNDSGGTPANYAKISAVAASSGPIYGAAGTDTDISPQLKGKGAGGGQLVDGAGTVRIAVDTTGIGFFATAPTSRATITGSRAGNGALANLLVELAAKGLVLNGTTA